MSPQVRTPRLGSRGRTGADSSARYRNLRQPSMRSALVEAITATRYLF
jgi:hypothetical protein